MGFLLLNHDDCMVGIGIRKDGFINGSSVVNQNKRKGEGYEPDNRRECGRQVQKEIPGSREVDRVDLSQGSVDRGAV
jgi:hypothetical protein